ncbi:unnamed protein product [Urochloa humidicola]
MANNAGDEHGHCHFLVVAYGLQGHLNPARALAHRLARAHGSAARVTLSVTVSAHSRMFPSPLASPDDEEVSDGLISYVPYSDGFDFGATPRDVDQLERSTHESSRSLCRPSFAASLPRDGPSRASCRRSRCPQPKLLPSTASPSMSTGSRRPPHSLSTTTTSTAMSSSSPRACQ